MITKHLRDFFRDDPDITNRVGPRIFPDTITQGEEGELLLLTVITSLPAYHLVAEVGKTEQFVQIKSYAANAPAAESLAKLVRNRLSGYRGNIGDGDASFVEGCRITSSGAGQDEPEDASDKWVYFFRQDFAMWETTDIPTLA